MEIKNPRRILFLGPPDSGALSLLKDLTGSAPEPRLVASSSSLLASQTQHQPQDATQLQPAPAPEHLLATTATTAGLTHALPLRNAYYTATIPVWLDEPASPAEWKADFLAPEAAEVVRALGAWVLVFRLGAAGGSEGQRTKWAVEMMDAVKEVVSSAYGGVEDAWDGVLLCVGMPLPGAGRAGPASDEWEDLCWDRGFEFVDWGAGAGGKERDANGETRGVQRIVEALEANDWSGEIEGENEFGLLNDEDDEDAGEMDDFGAWEGGREEEDAGFALERREMEREIWGLKLAVNGEADDDDVEKQVDNAEELQVEELERMMGKMLAVRDMTTHMPESERKKFAARAVNDVMKTM